MKKISVLLLVCLFLSTPVVFGQTRSELPDFLGERGARGGSGRAEPGLAAPGKRAFYSLAGHLVPPGSRELRIEVRIAGRPLLSDVLQLPLDAAGATFELLGGDPRSLERVFARAAEAGRRAQVVVSLDGRTLRTFSFSEFLIYNQQFEKAPPQIRLPLGEERTFAPEAGTRGSQSSLAKSYDPECVAGCQAHRDGCYQMEPSCAGVFRCAVCDNEYNTCRQSCWVCEDPKSVTDRTEASMVNNGYRGTACLTDSIWGRSEWWEIYDYVIVYTTIRRTEYCDGSVVETVISSWQNGSGTCIKWTGASCSLSAGSTTGVTTCAF